MSDQAPQPEELDRFGIIPGPNETADDLARRHRALHAFKDSIDQQFAEGKSLEIAPLEFKADEVISDETLADCIGPATERYDIALPWARGFYSVHGIALDSARTSPITPPASGPVVSRPVPVLLSLG